MDDENSSSRSQDEMQFKPADAGTEKATNARYLEQSEKEVFDYYQSPDFKARERRVVRKLDLYIAPLMGSFNFISYIDRSNIGFAATQGMTKSLNLKESDLNVAVSIFYVLYVLAELPISMYAKKWRFERVIPTLTIAFGAITLGSGFVTNYAGLVATRLILGLFQGCLFPCIALFVATWYKREELAVRVAFLYTSVALAGAVGGLIAYGIYHMDGAAGIAGRRWIYIVEGAVTVVYGFACFILIPSSYEKARFLNEDDREVMRYRAKMTHQYSGGKGKFTLKDIAGAAKDIKTWLHSAIQFCVITPLYGFSNFLPIILQDGLGFDTLQTQYLTIPVQLWGAIIYSVIAFLSDRYNKRYLFEIIFTPITALGYVLLLSPVSAGVQYFATYVITTGVYITTGNNFAWAGANSAPDARRAATIGIVLTFTDTSGVVVGQLYRSGWAPQYTLGHAYSLAMLLIACVLFTWVTLIYRRRNTEKQARQGEVVPEDEWSDRAPDFHYQW